MGGLPECRRGRSSQLQLIRPRRKRVAAANKSGESRNPRVVEALRRARYSTRLWCRNRREGHGGGNDGAEFTDSRIDRRVAPKRGRSRVPATARMVGMRHRFRRRFRTGAASSRWGSILAVGIHDLPLRSGAARVPHRAPRAAVFPVVEVREGPGQGLGGNGDRASPGVGLSSPRAARGRLDLDLRVPRRARPRAGQRAHELRLQKRIDVRGALDGLSERVAEKANRPVGLRRLRRSLVTICGRTPARDTGRPGAGRIGKMMRSTCGAPSSGLS